MQDSSNSIFFDRDWLSAICGKDRFQIIELERRGSELTAVFRQRKFLGMSIVDCPPFNPFQMRIIHKPDDIKTTTKYSRQCHLLSELHENVRNHWRVNFKLPSEVNTVSVLNQYNYKSNWCNTCFINANTSLDNAYLNLSSKTKNRLHQAQSENIFYNNWDDLSLIWNCDNYYLKHGLTQKIMESILPILKERNAIHLYSYKRGKNIESISIIIEDGADRYLWANIQNPKFKNRLSQSHILWKAIQESLRAGQNFHFDGSIVFSIENFFMGFGSEIQSYALCKWNKFTNY